MTKIYKLEIEIIRIAYDSWFTSVLDGEPNEVIAHRSKRLKYLIDWIGITMEMETKEINE